MTPLRLASVARLAALALALGSASVAAQTAPAPALHTDEASCASCVASRLRLSAGDRVELWVGSTRVEGHYAGASSDSGGALLVRPLDASRDAAPVRAPIGQLGAVSVRVNETKRWAGYGVAGGAATGLAMFGVFELLVHVIPAPRSQDARHIERQAFVDWVGGGAAIGLVGGASLGALHTRWERRDAVRLVTTP